MKTLLGFSLAGIVVIGAGVWAQQSGRTQNVVPDGDWRTINRDLAANRYSPLKQINTSNVSSLKEAWTARLGGGATSVPLVVNGVMYVSSGTRVVALDGDTGTEIWAHTLQAVAAPAPTAPPTDAQAAPAGGGGRGRGGAPAGPTASARGVGFWPGDGKLVPRILFMSGNRLIAVDAATGALIDTFGEKGAVTVGVPYGGTPTIYRNVAIIGAATGEIPQGPPGNPRAFDVVTGKKLWEFWTVPR